ncbi:MAG: YfhO family protein [Deltaproteobacteria bacterium]|nr:YfhO family protein [Deltaproteobacteria bacterium]
MPVNPVVLFNMFFVFLFVFYNVGCYLIFLKVFKDWRVALFCLAVSVFSLSFVVYYEEHSSFYVSIYFPYIVYFFLEFIERRNALGLALIPVLFGMAANVYVPHFIILAFVVFVASYFVFMDREYYYIRPDASTLAKAGKGLILALILLLPAIYVYYRFGDFVSPVKNGADNILSQDSTVTGHHQEYRSLLYFFAVSSYTDARCILYIGTLPLVLAGIGAFKSSNRFRWTVLAAALGIFFISLGRNSFPYLLIHYLPTFGYIRQYVIFEIFVQFLVILLAGMGLEYLMRITDEERKEAYILILTAFGAVFLVYAGIKYSELKADAPALVPGSLYLTFFVLSLCAVLLLVQSRSVRPYLLVMTVTVLSAGTLQWYLGDMHYDRIKHSTDAGELKRVNEVLGKDHTLNWTPSRHPDYNQRIQVLRYNTFESALDGEEKSFSEPVESNLLVNKRYYELAPLRLEFAEFFGVDYPKIFLTDDYSVSSEARVIPAMRSGYYDYLFDKRVWFAEEDLLGINGGGSGVAFANNLPQYKNGREANAPQPHYRWQDEFSAATKLKTGLGSISWIGDWFVLNAENADSIDIDSSNAGVLTIDTNTVKSYLWDSNFTGPFVYRELNGDFDVETHVTSNHSYDNEFAGIVIRNPNAGGAENWIAIETGSSGGKSVFYIINTTNGVSAVETASPIDAYLRAVRFRKTIYLYSRPKERDEWKLRARYVRPDLGSTLQVGLAAHPDNTKGTFVAQFDYYRVKDNSHGYAEGFDPVKVDEYTPEKLSLSVDAARPSFLVYLQNYDKDWRAYVNGVEMPILRVNYNFQTVTVPKGKSKVEFRYSSIYKYLLGAHLVAAFFSVGVMVYACRKAEKE